MKHVVAIVAAVVLVVFAGVVVWYNRTALTIPILGFSGVCLTLALLLAIPSDAKAAMSALAPYIPLARGGSPPRE